MALASEFNAALVNEIAQQSYYNNLSVQDGYDLFINGQKIISNVPSSLSLQSFISALAQPTQVKLIGNPSLIDIRDKIQAQDRTAVTLWATLLHSTGILTDVDLAAINTLLSATTQVTNRMVPPIQSNFIGVTTVLHPELPGNQGLAGFPNWISEADFQSCWTLAGRT